jgi:hypothetical protein
MSLPPWIKSIKRPLDALTVARRSFEDLPDTEPGEDSPELPSRRLRDAAGTTPPPSKHDVPFDDPAADETLPEKPKRGS